MNIKPMTAALLILAIGAGFFLITLGLIVVIAFIFELTSENQYGEPGKEIRS